MSEENQEQYQKHNQNQYQAEIPRCKSCGITSIEREYLYPLCTECRDKLSRRKFPFGVKVFFVIIALLLAISMSKFPNAINAGIHLQRGLSAEENKLYNTAMKEFEQVSQNYPDSTLALSKLYVSYYFNDKIFEAGEILDKIGGKEFDDEELINEANEITDKIERYYYYTEDFLNEMNKSEIKTPEEYIELLKKYHENRPNDNYVTLLLANELYDTSEFGQVKDLLTKLVTMYPDFSSATLLLAATYRETGEYEKGIKLCDKILEYNQESWSAYYSKSRLELKFHNDAKGLEYARISYNLEPENVGSRCNLALAYHYNNMTNERDSLKNDIIQQRDNCTDENEKNYIETELDKLLQIINGENNWRD